MRCLIVVFILLFPLAAPCQSLIDEQIDSLASHLILDKQTEEEKLEVIFEWVTKHISYDVNLLGIRRVTFSANALLAEVLHRNSGVCEHYAVLFHALCRAAGLEAYVVHGYSRGEDHRIDETQGHSWVMVAMADGAWYFFDPTWSAGYVDKLSFVQAPNRNWYKVQPKEMIKTHMPIDPLWQGLEFPVSYEAFRLQMEAPSDQLPFNYKDSLLAWNSMPELSKIEKERHRIEEMGKAPFLVSEYLNHLKAVHINLQWQHCGKTLNKAVEGFNHYVVAKNNFFRKPKLSEAALKDMVAAYEDLCSDALEILKALKAEDSKQLNYQEFEKTAATLASRVAEEKLFLTRYFSTPRPLRIFTFKQ